MSFYDVTVEAPHGKSGDTIRVSATDEEAAKSEALNFSPDGWIATGAQLVDPGSPALGVDETALPS